MLRCTYCGCTEFYGGAGAGFCANLLCANEECRHWFNATPSGPRYRLEDLNRVDPPDEKTKAHFAEKEAREKEKSERKKKRWRWLSLLRFSPPA